LDGKGEFFAANNPTEAPFTAGPLPDLVTNKMVQIAASDYIANTAGFAFWKAGALTFNINANQIPSNSPIQFNTNSFKAIIPPLYQKYPNMNMSSVISPKTSPTGAISADGVAIVASIMVDMFVNPDEKTQVPVFTLEVDVEADGKAYVNGNQIYGNITDAKFSLTLSKSEIGNFDVTSLNSFAEFLFEGIVIPYVNNVINIGITIPTIPNVVFVNPVLTYGPDYVIVATDVSYTAQIDAPCKLSK